MSEQKKKPAKGDILKTALADFVVGLLLIIIEKIIN